MLIAVERVERRDGKTIGYTLLDKGNLDVSTYSLEVVRHIVEKQGCENLRVEDIGSGNRVDLIIVNEERVSIGKEMDYMVIAVGDDFVFTYSREENIRAIQKSAFGNYMRGRNAINCVVTQKNGQYKFRAKRGKLARVGENESVRLIRLMHVMRK